MISIVAESVRLKRKSKDNEEILLMFVYTDIEMNDEILAVS